jgi:hypothetical protein
VTFDEFTFRFYDTSKHYSVLPAETSNPEINILTQMKEENSAGDTGFINSLIIVRTPIHSWTDIKELVDSNTKKLQLKLLKYVSTDNTSKKVKCDNVQYSWYMTAFSYQLDSQTIYDGQYFFTDDEAVYIISLSSDDSKDIKSFIKSIGTIKCIQ